MRNAVYHRCVLRSRLLSATFSSVLLLHTDVLMPQEGRMPVAATRRTYIPLARRFRIPVGKKKRDGESRLNITTKGGWYILFLRFRGGGKTVCLNFLIYWIRCQAQICSLPDSFPELRDHGPNVMVTSRSSASALPAPPRQGGAL